jgi:FkbM family methyltransferase
MTRFLCVSREILRYYLRKFPLRDGKSFVYDRLSGPLTPEERFAAVDLDAGFRMRLDLQDPVQRRMYFYGDYDERYEARMIRKLLERGEVFWDVGANIGYFTLLAAATLQHTGQVQAFEPGREAYTRLQENIALNPYRNISTHNLAVTDREGAATLYLPTETADGRASLYAVDGQSDRTQTCRTVSLDALAGSQGLARPDFIKIDVEGAELLALRGAARILEESRPLLLVELKGGTLAAAGTGKHEIQELLSGYGYLAAFAHRRRWYLTRDVREAKGRNLLWFTPAAASHREKTARLGIIETP